MVVMTLPKTLFILNLKAWITQGLDQNGRLVESCFPLLRASSTPAQGRSGKDVMRLRFGKLTITPTPLNLGHIPKWPSPTDCSTAGTAGIQSFRT